MADIDKIVKALQASVPGLSVGKAEGSALEVRDWVKMPELEGILGVPGFPCGLVTMLYGKRDSSKTTCATTAMISCQRDGGVSILLDTEHKYDMKRASAMGLVDPMIVRADTIEDAFEKFLLVIKHLREVEKFDGKICCVWDSLGATPSRAEMNEDVKDFSMTAAKIIKGWLRKLLYYIRESKVAFIIVNQVYSKPVTFGKTTTTYGGSGPTYHSAIMLEFTQIGRVRPKKAKTTQDFAGIKALVECTKNHLAQPFKKIELLVDWKGYAVGRDVEYVPDEIKAKYVPIAEDGDVE